MQHRNIAILVILNYRKFNFEDYQNYFEIITVAGLLEFLDLEEGKSLILKAKNSSQTKWKNSNYHSKLWRCLFHLCRKSFICFQM